MYCKVICTCPISKSFEEREVLQGQAYCHASALEEFLPGACLILSNNSCCVL